MSGLIQAPDALVKMFTELGFKKMWINKEYQKFLKMHDQPIGSLTFARRLLLSMLLSFAAVNVDSEMFEGHVNMDDNSVPTKIFIQRTGGDDTEGKIFQFLFDGNSDGKVDFDEVLQAYAFMETDDVDIQARLFFGLIDKDGNGLLSRTEMKQFLAIHHLKRTGSFPGSADQAELEDVLSKIFAEKDEMSIDEFIQSDHGMITMITFNMM